MCIRVCSCLIHVASLWETGGAGEPLSRPARGLECVRQAWFRFWFRGPQRAGRLSPQGGGRRPFLQLEGAGATRGLEGRAAGVFFPHQPPGWGAGPLSPLLSAGFLCGPVSSWVVMGLTANSDPELPARVRGARASALARGGGFQGGEVWGPPSSSFPECSHVAQGAVASPASQSREPGLRLAGGTRQGLAPRCRCGAWAVPCELVFCALLAEMPPPVLPGRSGAGTRRAPSSPHAPRGPPRNRPQGGAGASHGAARPPLVRGQHLAQRGGVGRPRGGQPGLAPRGQQRGRSSGGAGCPSEPESHLERGPSHCPVLREVRTTYPARGWGWWDGVALETLPQPGRRSEARTGGWAGAGARRGWHPSRRGTAVPGARPRTSPGRHSGTSRHFG